MAAPATVLHIPAGVGIDQETREEHVQPGQANLYTENARVSRAGGLEHRPGFEQFTNSRIGSGTRSAGHRLAALGSTVVASDGAILDAYSPSATEWAPRGRVSECSAKRTGIASAALETAYSFASPVDTERAAIAYGNGYYVVVTYNGDQAGGVRPIAHVVDATTKRVVFSADPSLPDASMTAKNARPLVVGTTCVVVWTYSTAVKAATLDLTNPSAGFSSATSLATDIPISGEWDAIALSSTFAIAYENNSSGTARITIKTFSPGSLGSAAATQTETTDNDAVTALCLAGASGEELWTVWAHNNTDEVMGSARDASTLSSIIAASTLMETDSAGGTVIAAGRTAAHEIYVVATSVDSTVSAWRTSSSIRAVNSSGSLVTSRSVPYIGGWIPASRPFAVAGRVYVELVYDDQTGGVYNVVLVDVTADATATLTLRPVAWLAPRLNRTRPVCNPRSVVAVSSTLYACVHTVWTTQRGFSVSLAEYDFGGQRHLPTAYADTLYLSGGIFQRFDGERVFEDGFVTPPRVNLGSSGTGLTGTFSYAAIYEYIDAAGNVIWSPPSPVQVITVSNKQIDVSVLRAIVTWKNGIDDMSPQNIRSVRTMLFRTADGGGTFYLVGVDVGDASNGLWSFTDTTSDATLISSSQLYKVPGVVGAAKDRQAVGAVQHSCECNGVLVVVDDSATSLRAYAERTAGEAPWHHDNLQLPIEGDGEIVALASLDGSVVVFKRTAIFVVPVEPANSSLTQGGFGFPRRIAVDAGCIDARSVVVTSLGVFFQSDRGIELLNRSLAVEPIGQKIQDTFASYPNVTAAVLDVKGGLVRFSLAQTGSSTVGIDAVFDLTLGAWITFDKKTGAAASAQSVSATYAFHSGSWRYMWMESDGTVHYESTSSWLDKNSTFAPLKWVPAWVKTELQREHQFWQAVLLHNRRSACGLLAEFAADWADYDSGDNKVWNEAAIATYTRQVELRWTKRGQAFKVRLSDSTPAVVGTGRGLEFVGLSVDLAPHQGPTQGTPRVAEAARR